MITPFGKVSRIVFFLSSFAVLFAISLWLIDPICIASPTPAPPPVEPPKEESTPGKSTMEAKLTPGSALPYNPGKILEFPSPIEGIDLGTKSPSSYSAKGGRATMVFFIASWCEPCQILAPKIRILADKYSKLHTDVVFVFTHDTLEEASQFAKDHSLRGKLLLSNEKILVDFKNPPLPSVYLSDRHKYMTKRYLDIKLSDLDSLSDFLDKINLL